jgi:hypothetical protein
MLQAPAEQRFWDQMLDSHQLILNCRVTEAEVAEVSIITVTKNRMDKRCKGRKQKKQLQ